MTMMARAPASLAAITALRPTPPAPKHRQGLSDPQAKGIEYCARTSDYAAAQG